MTLLELLRKADTWEADDITIYVEQPWSCDSESILVQPAPGTTEPIEENGRRFDYFLETFLVREMMEDYLGTTEGASASVIERCERLIRYARDDA